MADFFAWDEGKYGLSVPEMDGEHKKLVAMMNALHSEHKANPRDPKIAKHLEEFVGFALKHFADEEKHMEKVKFPQIESHKLIHKNLVKKVTEYVEEYKRRGQLSDEFFNFLKVWLASHIMGVDKKYSPKAQAA